MSNSSSPEMSEAPSELQEKPLPPGILNALDASVDGNIPWIIDHLLAEGEQMLVFGAPKVGKSQFALQLAMCVAMEEPFLGWQITRLKNTKPNKVLYLNFEMGNRTFMRRIARHYSLVMEIRRKRQCKEAGLEYFCESYPWYKLGDDAPLAKELRAEINDSIKDRLLFSGEIKGLQGDHVPKQPVSEKKGKNSDPKKDAETAQDLLVRYWQSVIEVVEPDLVIFDTLSKTHSINESDNSEIQQVLMRIRQICSVPSTAGDGVQSDVGQKGERKSIAHIIVHHARKSSPDFKKRGGNQMDLDSIRGGSAIRAEADVICGIMYGNNTPTATHCGANRHLVVEARNLIPFDQPLNFDEFAFCHPKQLPPEEVEAETNKKNELDQSILTLVRDTFVQSGMRGLMFKTMQPKVLAGLNKGRKKKFSESFLRLKLKSLAEMDNSDFEIRKTKDLGEKEAKYPQERQGGKVLYWIRDEHPWLELEPLKSAIKKHDPASIPKPRHRKAQSSL